MMTFSRSRLAKPSRIADRVMQVHSVNCRMSFRPAFLQCMPATKSLRRTRESKWSLSCTRSMYSLMMPAASINLVVSECRGGVSLADAMNLSGASSSAKVHLLVMGSGAGFNSEDFDVSGRVRDLGLVLAYGGHQAVFFDFGGRAGRAINGHYAPAGKVEAPQRLGFELAQAQLNARLPVFDNGARQRVPGVFLSIRPGNTGVGFGHADKTELSGFGAPTGASKTA